MLGICVQHPLFLEQIASLPIPAYLDTSSKWGRRGMGEVTADKNFDCHLYCFKNNHSLRFQSNVSQQKLSVIYQSLINLLQRPQNKNYFGKVL